MRTMRNKQTGRIAAYDAAIVAEGRWEEVVEAAPVAPAPAAPTEQVTEQVGQTEQTEQTGASVEQPVVEQPVEQAKPRSQKKGTAVKLPELTLTAAALTIHTDEAKE